MYKKAITQETLTQQPRRIHSVRNASYLTAANAGAKLFGLLFVVSALHMLGKDLYGHYVAIFSFVGLFEILTDLGLTNMLTRDVAQDRSRAIDYVSNILALRGTLAMVAMITIVVLAPIYMGWGWQVATDICALSLVPLAVGNVLQAVFQFTERLTYMAIYVLVIAGIRVGLSLFILSLHHGVLALFAVSTAVTTVGAVFLGAIVYTRFLPGRLVIRPSWWPALLQASVPFAMLAVLNVLYTRIDIVILAVLSKCASESGCAPVGLYNAASRALDVLSVIFIGGVQAATLPLFTRVAAQDRQALGPLVRSSTALVLVISVPIAVFGTFYARQGLELLGGSEYTAAVPAMAVLMWAFPCILGVNVLYMALYALNRQAVVTAVFAVNLVANVTFNVLLIPRYSYMASSILTVAAEILNVTVTFVALQRYVGPLGLGAVALKIGVIALVLATVLWCLRDQNILLGLTVGTGLILLGIRITGVLDGRERAVLSTLSLLGRFSQLIP